MGTKQIEVTCLIVKTQQVEDLAWELMSSTCLYTPLLHADYMMILQFQGPKKVDSKHSDKLGTLCHPLGPRWRGTLFCISEEEVC